MKRGIFGRLFNHKNVQQEQHDQGEQKGSTRRIYANGQLLVSFTIDPDGQVSLPPGKAVQDNDISNLILSGSTIKIQPFNDRDCFIT